MQFTWLCIGCVHTAVEFGVSVSACARLGKQAAQVCFTYPAVMEVGQLKAIHHFLRQFFWAIAAHLFDIQGTHRGRVHDYRISSCPAYNAC